MSGDARSVEEATESDLAKLRLRAFNRAVSAEDVLRRYHTSVLALKGTDVVQMRALHAWMFVPPTLWPFDVQGMLDACLGSLEGGKKFTLRQRLLIDLLPIPPSEDVCEVIAEHERRVQKGDYEHLVRTEAKYAGNELAICTNPDLRVQWGRICSSFQVNAFRDHKGVIRRTLGTERNLRPSFPVDLHRSEEMFRAVFDAFCLRWHLYGMQNDTPLPLKLTANATAYGTMIFVPAYWSFDPKRDIRWDAIADLHRVRVPKRQGPAFTEGFSARLVAARKLVKLDQEALRRKLTGQKKHEFLCTGLGWTPGTSPRRISRLRADFRSRVAATSTSKKPT